MHVVAPGHDALFQALRAFRRRLVRRQLVQAVGILLPLMLLAAALAGLACYLTGRPLPALPLLLTWGVGLLLASLGVWLLRTWPSLAVTARVYDRLAGSHDRSHTALTFASASSPSSLQQLAIAECRTFLATRSAPALPPIARPLLWLWLPPTLSLLLLYNAAPTLPISQPKTPPPIEPTIRGEMEGLLEAMEPADPLQNEAALRELANRLNQEMPQLATAELSEETTKALLQKAAGLEELLRELAKATDRRPYSPEELAALARALETSRPTASEALRNGDLSGAAQELERLMNQLASQPNPQRALTELAQSLREEAGRLDEAEKSALAEQMRQAAELAGSQEMQELRNKMEEISQLLAQQSGAGQPQGAAGGGQSAPASGSGQSPPMTRESIQQMLQALDELKERLQNQQPGEGQGSGKRGGQPQPPGLERRQVPFGFPLPGLPEAGGQPGPGSKQDPGTTESETGPEMPPRLPPEGPAKVAPGQQNAGESTAEMIGSSGDTSQAAAQYKAVYESLEAERAEAIQREEIPIGSRLFLKRYFEAIRPDY